MPPHGCCIKGCSSGISQIDVREQRDVQQTKYPNKKIAHPKMQHSVHTCAAVLRSTPPPTPLLFLPPPLLSPLCPFTETRPYPEASCHSSPFCLLRLPAPLPTLASTHIQHTPDPPSFVPFLPLTPWCVAARLLPKNKQKKRPKKKIKKYFTTLYIYIIP